MTTRISRDVLFHKILTRFFRKKSTAGAPILRLSEYYQRTVGLSLGSGPRDRCPARQANQLLSLACSGQQLVRRSQLVIISICEDPPPLGEPPDPGAVGKRTPNPASGRRVRYQPRHGCRVRRREHHAQCAPAGMIETFRTGSALRWLMPKGVTAALLSGASRHGVRCRAVSSPAPRSGRCDGHSLRPRGGNHPGLGAASLGAPRGVPRIMRFSS